MKTAGRANPRAGKAADLLPRGGGSPGAPSPPFHGIKHLGCFFSVQLLLSVSPPRPHPGQRKTTKTLYKIPANPDRGWCQKDITLILLSNFYRSATPGLQPCDKMCEHCPDFKQKFIFCVFLINFLKQIIVLNMTLFSGHFGRCKP
jgi:hypothetical protein